MSALKLIFPFGTQIYTLGEEYCDVAPAPRRSPTTPLLARMHFAMSPQSKSVRTEGDCKPEVKVGAPRYRLWDQQEVQHLMETVKAHTDCEEKKPMWNMVALTLGKSRTMKAYQAKWHKETKGQRHVRHRPRKGKAVQTSKKTQKLKKELAGLEINAANVIGEKADEAPQNQEDLQALASLLEREDSLYKQLNDYQSQAEESKGDLPRYITILKKKLEVRKKLGDLQDEKIKLKED